MDFYFSDHGRIFQDFSAAHLSRHVAGYLVETPHVVSPPAPACNSFPPSPVIPSRAMKPFPEALLSHQGVSICLCGCEKNRHRNSEPRHLRSEELKVRHSSWKQHFRGCFGHTRGLSQADSARGDIRTEQMPCRATATLCPWHSPPGSSESGCRCVSLGMWAAWPTRSGIQLWHFLAFLP